MVSILLGKPVIVEGYSKLCALNECRVCGALNNSLLGRLHPPKYISQPVRFPLPINKVID